MIRIGINGFGRIGRLALRAVDARENVEVVAINDVLSAEHLAYLLKYDSVHGKFKGTILVEKKYLIVNGKPIRITTQKNPENIAWDKVGVDVVIESSGYFTTKMEAGKHLTAGSKKVVISAPSSDAPMFVMGVNHTKLKYSDTIFSNASCTTNCIAPIAKVLNDHFKIVNGFITTIHCTTSSQNTVDGVSDNWRRGRAALNNLIPTSTSASIALPLIIPELKGKILAMAVRVPVATVSLIDFTVKLKKKTTYCYIKEIMKKAAENDLQGILGYTEDEVVSRDFVSDPRTSVFDAKAGLALNDNFFKIIAWYDNEYGYATKLIDLIEYSSSLKK
ncbi:type I glyceraldehyde-3-phosphate dehydrogenase [Lutibacter sp.]|uniref:type I glyceraldehyde-3-phosphate dehydrogenase n=1 Tax=Lutibacter sp. TaxID=1925666 RepID=UPI002732AD0C|nr:type I glyceraldehyde-3-phosphate dehydrogenase [Lutibacter sp.]MDP3313977.1 type I glyceraldehyde-3-phosphate dehydrogenase [Lutibacter sp.]